MTTSPKMDDSGLRLALERLLYSYRLLLAHKPVRDVSETIAEAEAALRQDSSGGEELEAWRQHGKDEGYLIGYFENGRFEAFTHAVINMVTFGPWDLRDSPKSLISNIERLRDELLGLASRAEPGAQCDHTFDGKPLADPCPLCPATPEPSVDYAREQKTSADVEPAFHWPASTAPELAIKPYESARVTAAAPAFVLPAGALRELSPKEYYARGLAEGLEEGMTICREEQKKYSTNGDQSNAARLALTQAMHRIGAKIKPRTDEREGK